VQRPVGVTGSLGFLTGQNAGTALFDLRQRIGEVLAAAVTHEFPKLTKVRVEIELAPARLADAAGQVRDEKARRREEIDSATEESIADFCACVGCSPFCPDHMCVLTPQRPPQCGRPFEMIKPGALYAWDDMSHIHHSSLHRDHNSFLVIDKGRCIDSLRGEWSGVNEAISNFTHGRTTRVQLHAVGEFPHTGCGCFRLIIFRTSVPREGFGVMSAGWEGKAPDGRSWKDLHYALGGKQGPGHAGAAPTYLRSSKFIQAHGGWDAVVWVDSKVAAIMGDELPAGVQVCARRS